MPQLWTFSLWCLAVVLMPIQILSTLLRVRAHVGRPGVGHFASSRFIQFFLVCTYAACASHACEHEAIFAHGIPDGQNAAISAWRPFLGASIRHGEADHPGPQCNGPPVIGFCITNPTSLAKKADTFQDLFKATSAHVITCSETAATENVQKTFQTAMRPTKVLWSPPVQSLTSNNAATSQRGKASGVALISKVAARPARLSLPEAWIGCTRFLHSVIQIGQSHCQVVTLYCKPLCQPGAMEYNNELLDMALKQIDLIPLPFLVLGDMNMAIEQFSSWSLLESQGCRTLDQLHLRLKACPMPFTCKEATCPDNGIVSASLVPFVTKVEVLDCTWLATHRPVHFQIQLPGQSLFAYHVRFPKSFVELCIADQDWANMQDLTGELQHANDITSWAKAVENNVHATLQKGLGSRPKLPKSFRGRCQPVKFVKCPYLSPVRPANAGSFEPSTEVNTISTRRKVTQVRRLESLARRLQKVHKDGQMSEKTTKELQQEWNAIVRSHAFGAPFLHWISAWPEISWPKWPLPSHEWVFTATQIARFQTEAALREDEKVFQNKLAFARNMDKEANNKQAYAQVRGPGMPRVFELGTTVSFSAMIVPGLNTRHHDIYADAEDLARLDPRYPIALGKHSGKIVELEEHRCLVHTADDCHEWEENTTIFQPQFVISPADIAKQLDKFWLPIWQRDKLDLDFMTAATQHTSFHHLFAQFPPHPDIHVDPIDPEAWQTALKKLKAKSARGTDLISAQELKMLPWSFVHALAKILATYESGFPSDFMHGLICPLSKIEGIPLPSQTRPITLLPQVYRLWAAATTVQITKILCAWVPLEVTGLLPGRGATATAYITQFMVELARKQHAVKSGLTLDIIKCFNCLRWDFCFHAMLSMGIPRLILTQWIGSIKSLTRHWLLHNQIQTAGPGSCGLPEGDQWSVLAMIATATTWVTNVRAGLQDQEGAMLSAYADNWAWTLSSVTDHQPALQKTLEVTNAAGVRVDWTKTWCWSTCHNHAKTVQQEVNRVLPTVNIPAKSSAADLGYMLQYSGNNTLGVLTTRIEKGLLRLARLQAMPHQLSTKEAMLRTSIFPAALHGSDVKPPAIDTMLQMRSKTARALFGSSANLSPAIALACTKNAILDPEYWLILRAIANARTFLAPKTMQMQQDFFWLSSRFRGSLSQVHGPASALAHLLEKVDWKIDRLGQLHVTAFLHFPLLEVSLKRIERFLQKAWMDKLVIMHTNKTKLFHFPDIARIETLAVLNKFVDGKRWLLIREIAGAFQTASQKQRWLDNSSGLCPFCNQPDSREHRLLECPIGAEVRQPYQQAIAQWIADESLFPAFPVISVYPEDEAFQLVHFRQPQPVWQPSVRAAAEAIHRAGYEVHWFTDGSCLFPGDPTARHAAFSVVLDLCCTDEERVVMSDQYKWNALELPTLQVACVARSQGEQDILRAETHAIVTIAENIGFGVIHCDSSAAIHNAEKALHACTPAAFISCEHMDLLMRLWKVRDRITIKLHKVKAHQVISSVSNPLLRYWAMGNDRADRAAQSTCLHYLPDFAASLQVLHDEISRDKFQLETVFHLHVELQEVRARAERNLNPLDQTKQVDHRTVVDAFSNWTVELPWRGAQADTQFLRESSFGGEFAILAYQWMLELKWPSTDDGPLNLQSGTSWIELALSFMCFSCKYLPVLRKDEHGTQRLIFPGNFSSAKDRGLTYTEAGTMMQKLVEQVRSLVPEQVWPNNLTHGKMNSMYRLGASKHFQGVHLRPAMPAQKEVIQLVLNAVAGSQHSGLDTAPVIPGASGRDVAAEGTWQVRANRAKLAMIKVRKRRRVH